MGVTKTDQFSEDQNRIARIAKVIGHPARVAILEYLIKSQQCVCGDLVEVLPLAQATVSQHLKELKQAGIITGNVEGTSVCYCINSEEWNKIQAEFSHWFSRIKSPDCC